MKFCKVAIFKIPLDLILLIQKNILSYTKWNCNREMTHSAGATDVVAIAAIAACYSYWCCAGCCFIFFIFSFLYDSNAQMIVLFSTTFRGQNENSFENYKSDFGFSFSFFFLAVFSRWIISIICLKRTPTGYRMGIIVVVLNMSNKCWSFLERRSSKASCCCDYYFWIFFQLCYSPFG